MPSLPERGSWILANGLLNDPPFAVLDVDLVRLEGTVRKLRNTQRLTHVHPGFGEIDQKIADRFTASYAFDTHRGRIEAVIDDRGDLEVYFTGTVINHWTARSVELTWGSRKSQSGRVMSLSSCDKLGEALERALPLMPEYSADQVRQLINPRSLAIIAATTAAWAVSHFFGIGELADLILIILGGFMVGAASVDIAKDLNIFAKKSLGAESEGDLDEAAEHFASAVAKGGMDLISTLLLRRLARPGRGPFRENYKTPWSAATGRPLNSTPGRWFYRARAAFRKPAGAPGGVRGGTSLEGDTWVSHVAEDLRGDGAHLALERLKTYRHEQFHSFLTPKLQVLRELRVQLRDGAYAKSHILRYLEEAVAEAWGRHGTVGNMPRAIGFPVQKGYVTLAQLGEEAMGIVEGSVNIGGQIYRVLFHEGSSERSVRFAYDDYEAKLGD